MPAFGQFDGHVGFEGRVFDRATGRPVEGALVIIEDRVQDFPLRQTYIVTDASGFFQVDEPPITGAVSTILVRCETPKGIAESSAPLYSELRVGSIYRRDFYLTMPRRQTKCTIGSGQ